MKYNFDKIIQRKGSSSLKWDKYDIDSAIPLWVADMDFEAPDFIRKALTERLNHGIFGYNLVDDSYYECLISWFRNKHNWEIKKEQVIAVSGVVPSIYACIQALCKKGDKVIVQSPVYNQFFNCITDNECIISNNQLLHSQREAKPSYSFDLEDFKKKCKEAKCLILCNPHTPISRIWSEDELSAIARICKENSVTIISDETHCELIMPGQKFVPMAVIAEKYNLLCISLNAPTKNFNLPGLQIANIICKDPVLYAKIDAIAEKISLKSLNSFSQVALKACYSEEGRAWLEELNSYISENYSILQQSLSKIEKCQLYPLEGTYLAWIDCRSLNMADRQICEELMKVEKIILNPGSMYGEEGFLRINLASPKKTIKKASELLYTGLLRLSNKSSKN